MNDKSSGNYNIVLKRKINKSIKRVIKSNYNLYSSPKGIRELRIKISEFLNKTWDYEIDYKNMLITSGSMQSIKLLFELLLEKDNTLLLEDNTFYLVEKILLLNKIKHVVEKILLLNKIKHVKVKLNDDGIDIDMFEKCIKKNNIKLVYVIPTFNNPTGICWSLDVRLKFLKIINKYNVTIIEDDPYSLINFTDEKIKSLYELNHGNNIIYLGTFSKYISSGINVGYILANKDIIDKLYSIKEVSDIGTSIFSQLVILDYLTHNDLYKDVQHKVKIYKRLLNKSIKETQEKYKNAIISPIKGGLFYTVKTNDKEFRINICAK